MGFHVFRFQSKDWTFLSCCDIFFPDFDGRNIKAISNVLVWLFYLICDPIRLNRVISRYNAFIKFCYLQSSESSSDKSIVLNFSTTPQSGSPSHIHVFGMHLWVSLHWNWPSLQVRALSEKNKNKIKLKTRTWLKLNNFLKFRKTENIL